MASTTTSSSGPSAGSSAGTTGLTRGPRWRTSTSRSPVRPRTRAALAAPVRPSCTPPCSCHFGKFVWVLDARAHRVATERSIAALYARARLLDATAERIEAPLDGALRGRKPAPARRISPRPPLVRADPGARLDQGGVLPSRVRVPRARHGDAVDRRPGSGRDRLLAADPRPTTRSRWPRCSTRSRRAESTSISAASAPSGSASAATTRRARRRSSRGSARWRGSAARTTSAGVGRAAAAHPRDVRAHSRRAGRDEGRELAERAEPARGRERVDQPCLVVTGRRTGVPWQQTKRIAERRRAASGCCYDEGTHVCNNIPYKYRPLVADWMRSG